MAHMIESAAFVKEPAWHGIGHVFSEAPTTEQMLKESGLDWPVETVQLATWTNTNAGPEIETIVDHKAVRRVTDGRILGVVGPGYTPLQNRDAFAVFERFLTEGLFDYEAAGSLCEGSRVWVLARMKQDMVVGKDDRIASYLLLGHAHDGTLAIRVGLTPVRVVCANTLAVALKDSDLVKIHHTSGSPRRIEAAVEVIEEATRRLLAAGEIYDELAARVEAAASQAREAEAERIMREEIRPTIIAGEWPWTNTSVITVDVLTDRLRATVWVNGIAMYPTIFFDQDPELVAAVVARRKALVAAEEERRAAMARAEAERKATIERLADLPAAAAIDVSHPFAWGNERRYSRPWIGEITDLPQAGKPEIRWGGYEAGALLLSASPGALVMYGQRDNRGKGDTREYAIVGEDGKLLPLADRLAARAYFLRRQKAVA